jgi:T5SS/PEP-CTERM-associated repeat protein
MTTDYGFLGGNLNDVDNYRYQFNGQTEIPPAVPMGDGVSITAASVTMFGTTSVGTFSGGLLNSGTITAQTFDGAADGASSGTAGGTATINAGTIMDGATAYAGGTINASVSIAGVAQALGGIISTGGAINAGGYTVVATGSGAQVMAASIVGNLNVSSKGTITAQTLSSSPTDNSESIAATDGTISLQTLAAAAGQPLNAYLTASNGGTITVSNLTTLAANTGDVVSVIVSGAGSTFNSGAALTVGGQGEGIVTVETGADVAYASIDAGSVSPGSGYIAADGGSIDIEGNATIGDGGTGNLSAGGGGQVTIGGNLVVANQPSSFGYLYVDGTNSLITVDGNATIGQQGSLSNPTIYRGGELYVEANFTLAEATASFLDYYFLVQDPGSILYVTGSAIIGDYGDATLNNLEGATSHFGGNVYVANQTGSNGTLLLSNQGNNSTTNSDSASIAAGLYVGEGGTGTVTVEAGSTLTIGADVNVGVVGTGHLEVEAGGTLQSAGGDIGTDANSNGDIEVTGAGSTWTMSGNGLYVGHDGIGTLEIESGGLVSTDYMIFIGASGQGTITVEGATSTFNVNGALIEVGVSGTGTFNVESGQVFSGAEIDVAEFSGSMGTVSVADATLDATSINVGGGANAAGGAGAIKVTQAGKLLVTGDVSLWNQGTASILGGQAIFGGAVANSGKVTVATSSSVGSNLSISGAVTGTGLIDVGRLGLVVFGSSVAAGQQIQFQGAQAEIKLHQSGGFTGTISGFVQTDIIDLSDIPYSNGSRVQVVGSTVIVTPANGSPIQLDFSSPPPNQFVLQQDVADGGTDVILGTAAPSDFFGAGTSDLLFQNAGGDYAEWQTNGATVIGGGNVGTPGSGWQQVGTGYFNTAKSDVLFESSAGSYALWDMNGTSVASVATFGNPGAGFSFVDVGNFDGTGNGDILFENTGGDYAMWQTNGTAVIGGGNVGSPGAGWSEVGIGDFNNDGKSDILFESTGGSYAIWDMNGTSVANVVTLGSPGAGWTLEGVGNFYGNGTNDLLFENTGGDYATWETNGNAVIGGANLGSPGTGWSFAAIGDYNGDGVSDILFQNGTGGSPTFAAWEMNAGTVANVATFGTPGASWTLQRTG